METTVKLRELYLIHCPVLDEREIQKRQDMHTYIADSFC